MPYALQGVCMSAQTDYEQLTTTINIHKTTRDRLRDLKPFESVTYEDLVSDMIDVYVENDGLDRGN